MSPRSLAEAAYEYALNGFAVLPLHYPNANNECSCGPGCRNIGKHPLTRNGLNDASTDPQTVQGWWVRSPNANIGLLTGIASGIVVVDIDDPEVFDALGLETIDTLTCNTGRGNGARHLYLRSPVQQLKSKTLTKGVDIRGEKGYVVAPPSVHASGQRYGFAESEVLFLEALSEFPEDLLHTILQQQTKTSTPGASSPPKAAQKIQVSPFLRLVGGGFKDITALCTLWNEGDVKCRCLVCGKVWEHNSPSNQRGAKRAPERCTGCGERLRR